MVKALKDKPIYPRLRVEDDGGVTYAVSCRHCTDPLCVRSCIAAALSVDAGGHHRSRSMCQLLYLHFGMPLRRTGTR